jgi:hypothetical protein
MWRKRTKPEKGSSSTMRLGPEKSSEQMATFLNSPPDKFATKVFRHLSKPKAFIIWLTCSKISFKAFPFAHLNIDLITGITGQSQ